MKHTPPRGRGALAKAGESPALPGMRISVTVVRDGVHQQRGDVPLIFFSALVESDCEIGVKVMEKQ